jgi:hypothetical protein
MTRPALYWRRVTYAPEEQQAMLDELVHHLTVFLSEGYGEPGENADQIEHTMTFPYWNVASLLKHEQFVDEREVRVVAWVPQGVDALDFRPSRLGLTPFVRLTGSTTVVGQDRPYVVTKPRRLPIQQLRVGPSRDPEAQIFGVRHALGSFGYDEVEVLASTVPLH